MNPLLEKCHKRLASDLINIALIRQKGLNGDEALKFAIKHGIVGRNTKRTTISFAQSFKGLYAFSVYNGRDQLKFAINFTDQDIQEFKNQTTNGGI